MLTLDLSMFTLKPKYSYKILGDILPTIGKTRSTSPIFKLFNRFEGISKSFSSMKEFFE